MRIKIITIISFISISLFSQENDRRSILSNLSLNDAVNYSLNNSPSLNIQRFKEQQKQEKLAQTKLDYLPDVYATSDLRRNIIIPTTPIPAFMIDPSASDDELMYMRFNTPWSSGAGLNVTFDLFNPATAGKKSEQEKQLLISRIDTQISENDLRAEVSQAYIDCVIAQSQLESLAADTLYFFRLMQETEKLYQLGKTATTERNLAEINHNDARSRYFQAKNILYDSKINLLNKLGVSTDDFSVDLLNLTDDIESLYLKMVDKKPVSLNQSLSQSRLSEELSLSQLRTRHTKLQYLPTLSLTGYYGANYFGKDLQLTNSDKWFGNSFLALSLRIPITQSFSTSKAVSQQKFQEMIAHENLREFQNSRNSEISKELSLLENLTNDYALKQTNLKLRNENLIARSAEKEKGYILESEFWNEKMLEQNARQEYLQAAYEVLSAYVRIERLMKR